MIALLFIPLLALCFRERGSHHEDHGTTWARVVCWEFPVTVAMFFIVAHNGLPSWLPIICGLGAWVGMMLGHSAFQGADWQSNAKMGLMTVFRLILITYPLWFFSGYYMVIPAIGLLGGVAYHLGYKITRKLIIFGVTFCNPSVNNQGTEWSEFLCGGVYGIALAICYFI